MTTRKTFISATAALAAAPHLAAAAAVPATSPSPSQAPIPKLEFDLAAFDALLDRDAAHKHLFADRKLDGGNGLAAVRSTLNAYGDIGVGTSAIATAIVLYHGASITMAMDDHVWNTYLLPVSPEIKQAEPEIAKDFESVADAKTKGNPLLKPKAGDYHDSVEALSADGLRLFVCNNALKGISSALAHAKKLHPAAVYADISAHLVHQTTIVPAGVWAIHYGQEKKYTLLQTS
jgi:intracellular sulfur oxidation DsrE/DsrF family protein